MQHYRVFTPLSAGTSIQAVNDAAGNIELITLGNDGGLYNLWPDPASDTGWQITSLNASQVNQGDVTSFTATTSATGTITVSAYFENNPYQSYSLSDDRWSPGWQQANQQSGAAKSSGGVGHFQFQVQNNALFYNPGAGGTSVQLSGDTPVSTNFVSGQNFAGFLEVFILGTDGSLYHVRAAPDLTQPPGTQPDPEAAPNWTQMVQLNPVQSGISLQFSLLTLANDKDGYSKLFAVTTTDDLYAIWQDAETTDWNFQEIEVPDYAPNTGLGPTEINVYMTEITVLDAIGAPRPKTTVTLWSSDETPAIVNGRSTNLDALTPYLCSANAAGKVTVLVEADTLDAPMLKVTTDFMDGEEYISVEPNAYIQEALLSMTPSGLTSATNAFSGQPVTVIPPDTPAATLDAIANGVSQCMSLAGTPTAPSGPIVVPGPDSSAAAPKYLSHNKKMRGLKYVPHSTGKFEHRIDFSQVKEQHWRFVFDHKTKNHRFETLTREQAASLMAERKATLQPLSLLGDWFDVDWGDVWDAIASVTEFVVTTVVDTVTNVVTAINAQITLLIDGITYLYEQAVDLVEQVFDAVEGIFESVGTFFEGLFDWFGFLFAWNDILLTQQALSQLITQVALPFATQAYGAGGTLNTLIKKQIQSFQNTLGTMFTEFLNAPGIQAGSILAIQQSIPPSDIDDQTAGTNLAFSSLIDNVNSVEFTNSDQAALWRSSTAGIGNPFTSLTDELVTSLGKFLDDPAFSRATEYFQAIGDNPDQFLQNSLAGIINVIQGALNAGLNVAKDVVDLIFKCIESALNTLLALLTDTLYVPLASELYTMVTGIENMTILGLFSLIVAIPVTIGYKILFNVAPFADQSAIDQFISDMNQAITPVTAAAKQETELEAVTSIQNVVAQFLGVIQIIGFPIYGVIEGMLDGWPVPPKPAPDDFLPPPKPLSVAALLMEFFLWTGSTPTTNAAPGCADADSFATANWYVGGLSPILDFVWMMYTSKGGTGTIMRNSGWLGTTTDWILGCTQFGMLCGLVAQQNKAGKLNAAATVQAFFAAIPGLFKFFRLLPSSQEYWALPILTFLDLTGDFGAGLAEVWVVNQMENLPGTIAATT